MDAPLNPELERGTKKRNSCKQRGGVSPRGSVPTEAESHFQEIATTAEQQFHVHQGADQLILFHKNTFEPDGVKTVEVIPGTSTQVSFGLKYLMVRFWRPQSMETARTELSLRI